MKTKQQTNTEILEGAAKDNNEISEVRVRHSDSVHPLDCSCELCIRTKFRKENPNEVVEELDWNLEGENNEEI